MKKPKYNKDQFFQTIHLPTGDRRVLDFATFKPLPHFMIIIITARGVNGKTYNAKDFAYKEWKESGKKTMWLRNLSKDIEKEQASFLSPTDSPKEMYENCSIKGSYKKGTLGVYDNATGEKFIAFQSMNNAESEKGTRTIYDYFFWDEFNVNSDKVTNLNQKWASLMGSTEDIVKNYGQQEQAKFFVFGNSKTINHPFIRQFGIRNVEGETTSIDVNGEPTIFVLCPTPAEKDIKQFDKDMKKNARYRLLQASGHAEHNYFNKFLLDDVNYVEEVVTGVEMNAPQEEWASYFKSQFVVYHKKRYYAIFQINLDNLETRLKCQYHVCELPERPLDTEIWTLNQNDVIEGARRAVSTMKRWLNNLMAVSGVSFEDIGARELFISSIK